MVTCSILLLNNNGVTRNPRKSRHMQLSPHWYVLKAGSSELVPVGQADTYRSDRRLTSQQLQSSLSTPSSILNDYYFFLLWVAYHQRIINPNSVRVWRRSLPLTQLEKKRKRNAVFFSHRSLGYTVFE